MSTDGIRAALAEAWELPQGRLRVDRLERLSLEARTAPDRALEAQVLLNLVEAYLYGGERDRMPVAFARLLKLLDEHPAEAGRYEHDIHWTLKWMTSNLVHNPAVPLVTVYRWLDELESRYRQRGHSIRPVLQLRSELAQDVGDQRAANAAMETALAAPRDEMSDCEACERNGFGGWRVGVDDDEGALEFWAPVISGDIVCKEEPHRVLAKALLPLVRAGRIEEARSAHLKGYPMVRRDISLRSSVASHIEFCALTGNEARGLEILQEHAGWLTDPHEDVSRRLGMLGGIVVLLRRLDRLGHGELPLGERTVSATRSALEAEITELAGRYDARNGSTVVSERVAARLDRRPLLDRLPLGSPTRLRRAASTGTAEAPPRSPAGSAAGPSGGSPEPGGPEELARLVAEARRLAACAHPHTGRAWDRVAAWGPELPEPVAIEVARNEALKLIETDPVAAREALRSVTERFAAIGRTRRVLQTRVVELRAAIMAAAGPADLQADIEAAARALPLELEAALTAGDITTADLLSVQVNVPLLMLFAAEGWDGPSEADVAMVRARLEAELAMAEEQAAGEGGAEEQAAEEQAAGEPGREQPAPEQAREDRQGHGEAPEVGGEPGYPERTGRAQAAARLEHLGQLGLMAGAHDEARDRLTAAVAGYERAGEPWNVARPCALLAQLALGHDDPVEAERRARQVLALGADLHDTDTDLPTHMVSLLVEAVSRQPGRELDLVEAALDASARWEGVSEPDTLHNTFIAARAYQLLGRHAEAAGLYEQVMPRVEVPYDAVGIAMTRQQYGSSLSELGRSQEAAEQYLLAARLMQDDPDNQVAHAQLAWAAAEALRDADELAQALGAYRRAADLWAALGELTPAVRCRRSVAWVLAWLGDQTEEPRDPGAEQAGVVTMREVLADLEALAAGEPEPVRTGSGRTGSGEPGAGLPAAEAEEVNTELAETRRQLDAMIERYS